MASTPLVKKKALMADSFQRERLFFFHNDRHHRFAGARRVVFFTAPKLFDQAGNP
jgi:hypothetical protein